MMFPIFKHFRTSGSSPCVTAFRVSVLQPAATPVTRKKRRSLTVRTSFQKIMLPPMIIDDPNPKGLVRGSDAWKLFRSPRWYPTIAAAEDPASSTRSSCHHIQLLVFDVHFHLSFTMAKYSRWTKGSILDQHGLQKISAWLCSGHQAERSLFDDLDQLPWDLPWKLAHVVFLWWSYCDILSPMSTLRPCYLANTENHATKATALANAKWQTWRNAWWAATSKGCCDDVSLSHPPLANPTQGIDQQTKACVLIVLLTSLASACFTSYPSPHNHWNRKRGLAHVVLHMHACYGRKCGCWGRFDLEVLSRGICQPSALLIKNLSRSTTRVQPITLSWW